MKPSRPENTNLLLAVLLSTAILLIWQFAYEMPRQKIAAEHARVEQQQRTMAEHQAKLPEAPHEVLLAASPRLPIRSATLHGSVALKGLLFDDLTLAKYRESLEPSSPEVVLLSPAGNEKLYFIQLGWLSGDANVKLPGNDTLWKADGAALTPQTPVRFSWDNGQGITFHVSVALDAHYLFSITQSVENHTQSAVTVKPYAFINRSFAKDHKHFYILHEGPLGVFDGVLNETTYAKLNDKQEVSFDGTSGWLGVTDKYWLTALVPGATPFTAHFSHYTSKGLDRYQADYSGAEQTAAPGGSSSSALQLFAGAKELPVLDAYTKQYKIPLFDRAVDFGIYYFLTKPIFITLNYFYSHIGNFGVAILLLTVIIKLLMYPLANKSYVAMSHMKRLQPKLEEIKKRYGEDKLKLQQEMMALYKREKVNPAAGCLPMLVQIPVFFSLYKVLFVTIEMRQAPFILWIRDLSMPDPLNVFTLFGYLHWTPPAIMHLGILPILFCITMIIQQRLNPPPADPVQAKMFAYLPFIFLFLFASFPAGLVVYWTWSNILSILQQKLIMHRYDRKHGTKKK